MFTIKKIQKYVFSYFGLILLLCVIVSLNAIIGKITFRADVTEEKLYTLSNGTKNILRKLDSPVNLRFYRSRSENRMPVQLRSFAERIKTLLDEYVRYGNGNIVLDELDPTPDSNAEDSATMDNIRGQPMPTGEKLFLGLAVNFLDKTVSIPIFLPHDDSIIEYNITSAISEAVASELKKKIGIITGLPVLGEGPGAQMRGGRGKTPWIIIAELQKRFDVVSLNNAESIPQDVTALMLLHPTNVSDKTLFAIDQYLMKGGKLLLALDSYCRIESMTSMQAMMGQASPPGSSNLERFLKNWNLEFSQNRVVFDIGNAMRNLNVPESESSIFPAVLDIVDFAKDSSDPAISGIKHLNMVYAGAFSGNPAQGIKLDKIICASDNSELIDSFKSELGASQVLRDFKKDMKEKILMAKLSGKFKTAFPQGCPKDKPLAKSNADKGEESKNNTDAEVENKELKESPETMVILISDVDMFADEFCAQKQNFLGSVIIQPFNDNLIFLQNIIEQLSGDPDLLAIRSRKIRQRPFTKIVKKLAEAQDKYQQEILQIEKSREDVEAKINELQRGKTGGQQFILSKQQREEIEKYRKLSAITAKKLKDTRKELRKDIDKMQFNIQLANTGAVPIALVLIGIGLWLNSGRRRRK